MELKEKVEAIAKGYAKIRAKQNLLAIEEQELKKQMLDIMVDKDLKTIDGKYGNFTYSTRTTKTIKDPRVAECEVALKTAKQQAIEDGLFEAKESAPILTYKPVVKKD